MWCNVTHERENEEGEKERKRRRQWNWAHTETKACSDGIKHKVISTKDELSQHCTVPVGREKWARESWHFPRERLLVGFPSWIQTHLRGNTWHSRPLPANNCWYSSASPKRIKKKSVTAERKSRASVLNTQLCVCTFTSAWFLLRLCSNHAAFSSLPSCSSPPPPPLLSSSPSLASFFFNPYSKSGKALPDCLSADFPELSSRALSFSQTAKQSRMEALKTELIPLHIHTQHRISC